MRFRPLGIWRGTSGAIYVNYSPTLNSKPYPHTWSSPHFLPSGYKAIVPSYKNRS